MFNGYEGNAILVVFEEEEPSWLFGKEVLDGGFGGKVGSLFSVIDLYPFFE